MSDELTTKPTAENTELTTKPTTKLPLSKRYKKDEIVLAIGRNKGLKSAVCRELDCSIYELNHYLNIHSELKPLIKDAKQEIVALAEERLLQNLNSADESIRQRAVEFILKTLGKAEYSTEPSTQINVVSDKEIEIKNIFGI